jgi:hypothetical protein
MATSRGVVDGIISGISFVLSHKYKNPNDKSFPLSSAINASIALPVAESVIMQLEKLLKYLFEGSELQKEGIVFMENLWSGYWLSKGKTSAEIKTYYQLLDESMFDTELWVLSACIIAAVSAFVAYNSHNPERDAKIKEGFQYVKSLGSGFFNAIRNSIAEEDKATDENKEEKISKPTSLMKELRKIF